MRIFMTMISMVFFATACQSTRLGFISENRQEVTIGYMKYSDKTRRAEATETDADIAFNASVNYINKTKVFPFRLKVKTLYLNEPTVEGTKKNITLFEKNMSSAAVWVATKSTGINLSIAPISLTNKVPMMFPITSKSLFTQGYPNLYQLTPSNNTLGFKTWELAKILKVKNLLLIADSSIIYSAEYAEAFLNMNKVAKDKINVTSIIGNFTESKESMLDEIKERLKNNPYDAIFFPGFAGDINAILHITEDINMKIPVIVGDEGGDTNLFDKLKGLNSVYYLAYYPVEIKTEDNPKTKSNIEAFKTFYQTSGEGLVVSQFYYSVPLMIGEIVERVLSENPSINNKETFYELFNNMAKSKPVLALSDWPIQLQADGTIFVNPGELNITQHTLKGGIVNTGRI